MKAALPRPSDLARWVFWVPLRNRVSSQNPKQIARLNALWPTRWAAARSTHALMEDEYRRWFGRTISDAGYRSLVRDAYRQSWRVHVEELVLGGLHSNTIDDWVSIDGIENLEEALGQGNGVILVYPHAGPVMLMIAALAFRGFPYVHYAGRGLAPERIARAHPDFRPHNRWTTAVREAREAHENALSVECLTDQAPARELHRCLEDNKIVGIAFDGRIGSGWFTAPFLNRTALLSRGPWTLATSTGATVLPVFCTATPRSKATVHIGSPTPPQPDWKTLAHATLPTFESWLRKHPAEYGLWLLHTRQRSGIDAPPLFTDTAADDRFKRWLDG